MHNKFIILVFLASCDIYSQALALQTRDITFIFRILAYALHEALVLSIK